AVTKKSKRREMFACLATGLDYSELPRIRGKWHGFVLVSIGADRGGGRAGDLPALVRAGSQRRTAVTLPSEPIQRSVDAIFASVLRQLLHRCGRHPGHRPARLVFRPADERVPDDLRDERAGALHDWHALP